MEGFVTLFPDRPFCSRLSAELGLNRVLSHAVVSFIHRLLSQPMTTLSGETGTCLDEPYCYGGVIVGISAFTRVASCYSYGRQAAQSID